MAHETRLKAAAEAAAPLGTMEPERITTMAKRTAVKDLRAGSIEATPMSVESWESLFRNYFDSEDRDANQFWEAQTCQECGAIMVFHVGGGDEKHCELVKSASCEGYFSRSEGPMMNYWYKVDLSKVGDDPEEAARLIADIPLCVVQVQGEYGLALTSGGMDLSWEICEAYTRLGQLPPVHFCDLPRMAGRGTSARDRYIVAACRESLRVQMNWAKNKLRNLRGIGR
jgi:hypothetical protein